MRPQLAENFVLEFAVHDGVGMVSIYPFAPLHKVSRGAHDPHLRQHAIERTIERDARGKLRQIDSAHFRSARERCCLFLIRWGRER